MPSPIQFDRPPVISLGRAESTPQIEENGPSFGDLFKKVLSDTSGLQDDARGMIEAYLRGEPVELHQVMAASEEASISLELLVELRNKLTDAYRAVMNIQ